MKNRRFLRSVRIKKYLQLRETGVMCCGISRRFSFRNLAGKSLVVLQDKLSHEIIVDVNSLGTVATGLVRGVDGDFLHKRVKNRGSQFFRFYVLLCDFQKTFDIDALLLGTAYDAL